MRIKAEGDYEGAYHLFETYGDPIDIEWRDQVVAALWKALDMPARVVPVNAFNREPVTDAGGKILDVKVVYPRTIEEAIFGTAGSDGK